MASKTKLPLKDYLSGRLRRVFFEDDGCRSLGVYPPSYFQPDKALAYPMSRDIEDEMENSERDLKQEWLNEDAQACALFPELDGPKLKAYRQQKELTLEQFANYYGLNVRTLRRWEAGHATPKYSGVFSSILADWNMWIRSVRQSA